MAVFFIASCSNKEHLHTIAKAEKLLDINPDSAYQVLHTIENPKKLNKKLWMKFTVLDVLAKYKTYQDVKKDTLIFKAADYFNRTSNLNDKALANYAAASVMNENERFSEAMIYYKNTEMILQNSDNHVIKGLVYANIAYLYDKQLMFSEAIKNYKVALNEYSIVPNNIDKQINLLIFLGSKYLLVNQINNALDCYHKAYNLSIKINDINSQSFILNNIGLIYQQKKEYNKAIKYFKNAVNIKTSDKNANYQYTFNLASNYLFLNKIDSAEYLVENIENSLDSVSDLNYKAAVTVFLKDFYKKNNDFLKSISYLENHNSLQNKLFEENQSKVLLEAEKKYDYSVHKSEAEKAKLSQRIYVLLFIGIILLIAIASIIIWFRYSRQKLVEEIKIKSLQIKQQQQEAENQLLQGELGRFKYINLALHKVMEKANDLHFEIKDIVQAGILHEKSERHRKIQLKLKETQDTIKENIAYNAESFLIERSLIEKNILSKLTDEEKIILTMLFYKESRKNIATLLSISPQAVYNRVPRLKNKLISLGFEFNRTDIFFNKDIFELE